MWISMTCGFFSVVEFEGDPTKVVVRARVRDDLLGLREWVPMLGRIHATPHRDYPFRCFVSKVEFGQGLAAAVTKGLLYGNFKSAACKSDPRRADVLTRAWGVFRQLQELDEAGRR